MPNAPTSHRPLPQREPWQRTTPQKRIRGRRGMDRRVRIAQGQGWLCRRCGEPLDASYEVDHRVPLSRGGNDIDDNLQALHKHCHDVKTKEDRSRG